MTSYTTRCLAAASILDLVLALVLKCLEPATTTQFYRLIVWNCFVAGFRSPCTAYHGPESFPHVCKVATRVEGTPQENTPVPEGVGIISGAMFLVCLILCQLFYAYHNSKGDGAVDGVRRSATDHLFRLTFGLL